MFIIDPETGAPADETPNDPASAAAGGDEPAPPAADEGDSLMAALDKGVEEASEATAEPEPEALAADEPPAAEPVPGTPEAAAAKAAADKAKEGQPEPDKDTEDEIKALGLKEKSAERFRSMAAEIKGLAPIKEQLEKAGIKDVAELPRIIKSAQDGEYLVESIEKTGVSPEDFTRLLSYASTITAARSGDRAAVEKALEVVGAEYRAIAQALGKEVPGVFDPLAEHTDLAEAIEAGDMTRKHALEVAQARRTQAATQTQQEKAQAAHRQQQEAQQAQQRGLQSLVEWERGKMTDPAYAPRRAVLNEKVAEIRKDFPPEQWAAATELAYQAIVASTPAAAPPAAPPRPPAGNPVRPNGPRGGMTPASFDSPMDALDFGIQQASAG